MARKFSLGENTVKDTVNPELKAQAFEFADATRERTEKADRWGSVRPLMEETEQQLKEFFDHCSQNIDRFGNGFRPAANESSR